MASLPLIFSAQLLAFIIFLVYFSLGRRVFSKKLFSPFEKEVKIESLQILLLSLQVSGIPP